MSRDGQSGWMWAALGVGSIALFASLGELADRIGAAAIPVWFAALAGVTFVLRGPVGEAIAQRLRGGPALDGALAAELHERLDALEAAQQRIAELEERVDFAERLLAKQADATRLGRGDGG